MPAKLAAAYCRVSTEKAAQLDSYTAQKDFFIYYCQKCGYTLVRIYGDEGKSGTRLKGRPQLAQLLQDAAAQKFELVLVKDVSRLARNVLDFLSALRTLRSLGIEVLFVNADLSSSTGSEFILTVLSAIAQEESAGLSRRIKFGKQLSAQKGRVPNRVYGYRRLGRYALEPDPAQAAVVQKIFSMYVCENFSMAQVAAALNAAGIQTGCHKPFSAKAVSRILHNSLYTGRVICGKSEVADFLTGQRRTPPPERRFCTLRPTWRLVSDELFEKAQKKAQRQMRRASR